MSNITFANPHIFYLLILLAPMIVWYVLKHKQSDASIQVSSIKGVKNAPRTYKYYLRHSLFVLRCLVIALLITVLARPQDSSSWQERKTEGIDIVIATDISSSMLAQDFKPNRLEVAKKVAMSFINGRRDDRIGLVVFSGESFTQCPLTTDHAVLINLLNELKSGMIEDGTAIGLGLGNAVNRLKDSDAKSRVVILLTDGENNRGEISPLTAAELAMKYNIRVYTIGIGSKGTAPYPVQTFMGVQYQQVPVKIDEGLLTQIAESTGGKYFRATSESKLRQIYAEIDKMEKIKISTTQFTKKEEKFLLFALMACALLLIEILLRNTILRNIP